MCITGTSGSGRESIYHVYTILRVFSSLQYPWSLYHTATNQGELWGGRLRRYEIQHEVVCCSTTFGCMRSGSALAKFPAHVKFMYLKVETGTGTRIFLKVYVHALVYQQQWDGYQRGRRP